MSDVRTFVLSMSYGPNGWEIRTTNNEGYNQIDRTRVSDASAVEIAKRVSDIIQDNGRTVAQVRAGNRERKNRLVEEMERLKKAQARIAEIEKILSENPDS